MLMLPMQIEEFGEDIAIEEFRKVVGRSNTIDITVAGS
jgi:hypothetical protein